MEKSYIIEYHSPDIDVETFSPKDKGDFGFLLQVFIGTKKRKGEECFDIFICTPRWIERNYSKHTILLGLHTLIVQEYNYERLIDAVEELFCEEADSWDDLSKRLNYYGLSEMDYYHWRQYGRIIKCGVPEEES